MDTNKLTEREFAALVQRRARIKAREGLIPFCKYIMPAYQIGRPHRIMAEALERVERGECTRLIVSMPRRHGKSLMISQMFPCWCLGRKPRLKIVQCGYAENLTVSHSRKARDILAGEKFHSIWPEVGHRPETEGQRSVNVVRQTAHEWGTAQGGSYYAVGVGGGLAGRGFHCLPAGTMIETSMGEICIENLNCAPASCKVVGYDTATKRTVFRRIKAVASRQANGIYRITTQSGRVVEATGEHPFWTGIGYTKAADLAAGDTVLCLVRKGIHSSGILIHEAEAARTDSELLQPVVRRARREQCERENATRLSRVREKNSATIEVLQQGMSGRMEETEETKIHRVLRDHSMPILWEADTGSEAAESETALFFGVCGQAPFNENVQDRESELETRSYLRVEAAAQRKELLQAAPGDTGSGPLLCGVRLERESAHAPHRHAPGQQRVDKPCDALREMSLGASRCGSLETEEDTVSLVECIRKPTMVFNIQVQGTENYFANGILTHNCGIIDDFFKGRSDAQSPTIRDKVYDWFRSVFYPAQDSDLIRENAAIIITATRWHPDDLIARVQKLSCVEGDDEHTDKWEVIELPAIDNDNMALWPERWPIEKLLKIKATIGSREFSAQYQQDPKDVEGGMMRREWFKIVSDYPRRPGQPFVRFWDLAGTEKSVKSSDPDWTVGSLVTMVEGVWYIVNIRRFRATEKVIRNSVQQCAATDPYGTVIRIEQEPGAGSKNLIANYQTDVLVGYDVRGVPSVGDKALRAGPLAAAAEAGNVCIVNGPNVEAFLSEAEAMPNGDHDDVPDSITGAMAEIAGRRIGGSVALVERTERERTVDGQDFLSENEGDRGGGRRLVL